MCGYQRDQRERMQSLQGRRLMLYSATFNFCGSSRGRGAEFFACPFCCRLSLIKKERSATSQVEQIILLNMVTTTSPSPSPDRADLSGDESTGFFPSLVKSVFEVLWSSDDPEAQLKVRYSQERMQLLSWVRDWHVSRLYH